MATARPEAPQDYLFTKDVAYVADFRGLGLRVVAHDVSFRGQPGWAVVQGGRLVPDGHGSAADTEEAKRKAEAHARQYLGDRTTPLEWKRWGP